MLHPLKTVVNTGNDCNVFGLCTYTAENYVYYSLFNEGIIKPYVSGMVVFP